jgi:hypothetical protein
LRRILANVSFLNANWHSAWAVGTAEGSEEGIVPDRKPWWTDSTSVTIPAAPPDRKCVAWLCRTR